MTQHRPRGSPPALPHGDGGSGTDRHRGRPRVAKPSSCGAGSPPTRQPGVIGVYHRCLPRLPPATACRRGPDRTRSAAWHPESRPPASAGHLPTRPSPGDLAPRNATPSMPRGAAAHRPRSQTVGGRRAVWVGRHVRVLPPDLVPTPRAPTDLATLRGHLGARAFGALGRDRCSRSASLPGDRQGGAGLQGDRDVHGRLGDGLPAVGHPDNGRGQLRLPAGRFAAVARVPLDKGAACRFPFRLEPFDLGIAQHLVAGG